MDEPPFSQPIPGQKPFSQYCHIFLTFSELILAKCLKFLFRLSVQDSFKSDEIVFRVITIKRIPLLGFEFRLGYIQWLEREGSKVLL